MNPRALQNFLYRFGLLIVSSTTTMRRSPSPRAVRTPQLRAGLPLAILGALLVASASAQASSAAAPTAAGVPSPPATDTAEPSPTDTAEPSPGDPPPTGEPGDATPPDVTDPSSTDPPTGDPGEPAPVDPPPALVSGPAPIVPTGSPPPVIAPVDPPAPAEPPDTETGALTLRVEPGIGMCLGRGCRHFRIGDATGSIGVGGSLAAHVGYRAARHLSFEVGGLAAIHGNDIESGPASAWFLAQAGPRLHLFGGRFPAEPVIGLHVGWVRSLVRWSNAGSAADGLALGADMGVQLRLTSRLGLAFLGSAVLPYWTRVCEADRGVRACHGRSELTDHDLQRYFFVTSVALTARLR